MLQEQPLGLASLAMYVRSKNTEPEITCVDALKNDAFIVTLVISAEYVTDMVTYVYIYSF